MSKILSALVLAGVLCMSGAFAAEEAKPAAKAEGAAAAEAKVSVIGDNKTFHKADCSVIVKAKEEKKAIKEMTVAEAEKAGFAACKKCLKKEEKKEEKAAK